MRATREVFFLGEGADRRFCLVTRPTGPVRGAVLHVHAFAEELNRSRRMVALAAKAFAEAGWLVMQLDAHGCGDSEGDICDASWDSWLADIDTAHQWLSAHSTGPTVLWTHRAGSLLASDWLRRSGHDLPVLCWQPVLQGKRYLTQFLRIKLGASLVDSAQAQQLIVQVRAALADQKAVWVGGYELPPAIAHGLEESTFTLPAQLHAPIILLEVGSGTPLSLTPALSTWLSKLDKPGHAAQARVVSGPKFWQSSEVEVAPALIEASLDALRACAP